MKSERREEADPLVFDSGSNSSSTNTGRYFTRKNRTSWILLGVIAAVVLGILIIAIAIGVGVSNSQSNNGVEFSDTIRIENLMDHLQEWQAIAERNQNSRSVVNGYEDTANSVFQKLSDAGYKNLTKSNFKVATYEDDGGHSLSAIGLINGQQEKIEFLLDSQFSVMGYSGATSGVVTGELIITDCGLPQFPAGGIALVDFSICQDLFEVAYNAKEVGATALIFSWGPDDESRNSPPFASIFQQTVKNGFEVVDLPMLGLNYPSQNILYLFDTKEAVNISVQVNTKVQMHDTFNVLCYTDGGKADSIIVVGSHLDSVPTGPGINDNGSGSSANLEMALQLIKSGTAPANQILFAFWGAAKWGLGGSTHYVTALSKEAREQIALYLNFDRIGSPNFIRGVYDGASAKNQKVAKASTVIRGLFEDRLNILGLGNQRVAYDGSSDYVPFIQEGVDIPAGGLFTGSEKLKTIQEQKKYGGFASAPLDPCYGKPCDTVDNINGNVLEQMSQAAAYVLNQLMMEGDLKAFLNQ